MVYPAHAHTPEEVAKYFNSDLEKGLTDEQVLINREKYGVNSVPPPKRKSIFSMILEQFQDPMVIILLISVVLGFIFAYFEEDPEERTTAFIEPWVIIFILVVNATIAVYQDLNAQKSVEALKEFTPSLANVIRNGELREIPAVEVVCGDLVDVSEGRAISADIRLCKFKSSMVAINESNLTGEPVPVQKSLEVVKEDAVVNDRINVAYKGTPLERGGFIGIAYAVGKDTQMGYIEETTQQEEEVITPLQRNLDNFSKYISVGILFICVITWFANISKFDEVGNGNRIKGGLMFFKIAISLAVAAIPEGLPAVVTMTLSLGVNRMAKSNAIVTKLPAVETLGCTSVICSDKTGTLTTNKMVVQVFATVIDGKSSVYQVQGKDYDPDGALAIQGQKVSNLYEHKAAQMSAMVGTLANDGAIIYSKEKGFGRKGEPTDAAIKVFAEKVGLPTKEAEEARLKKGAVERMEDVSKYWYKEYPKVRTHEFTRARKSMSCIVGKNTLVMKGAFEVILAKCDRYIEDMTGEVKPLTEAVRKEIDSCRQEWAGKKAYRCIGLAYKECTDDWNNWNIIDQQELIKYESGCIWAGSVGILDPERPDVAQSIKDCYNANIRVIMCTGDNPETATAIARNIHMLGEHEDPTGKVFTGAAWEKMNDAEKREAAKNAVVLARVEPKHKRELVGILQEQNNVVAMTGDGVNDAPALSKADIGIAMGTGTTVAQGAAQMILSDDSFSTIVKAVREGRAIYNNTTSFIRYLLTCNIGEVVCCFVSSLIGGPNLLRSTQLLFVNLVTDGLPATALGVNPAEPNVMDLPPRPKDENIITPMNLCRYIVGGVYLGLATIAAAYYHYILDPLGPHLTYYEITHYHGNPHIKEILEDETAGTMAMTVLVIIEMFSALTAVSEHLSFFQLPPHRNPKLILSICGSVLVHLLVIELPITQKIFSVVHLNCTQWAIIVLLAFPVVIIEEIFKFYIRKTQKHIHIVRE
ncbi:sarcoplasmic-endoplasmic reticulum calcium ATPase [Trichomonas vaginalis G3]|uniref:Calcium-transporting ATPase n=1 Tax=Trichomonas vaginalis (strain ATCC PRA-98 / G3) TaxID=412133 RepID=A2DYG8_TRIV3|nr:cation-transporting ATPase [Trichomonas vaginalis G3]EAY14503.1 sarcoplasmic-endoplasmic reticulum calcium ATPase [Trichomonas vaginalis G3]KAI5529324.1 cation-transporting ATPase [Trichomonas vaginalis G3]|eukprot:XP_001326726.1 sarcoplasmic-endoplasmic reticulum calcium ATPase [Trichomonas vaginalis G3]